MFVCKVFPGAPSMYSGGGSDFEQLFAGVKWVSLRREMWNGRDIF